MGIFRTSVVYVLLPFAVMFLVAYCGLFHYIELEIGHEYYAEQTWLHFCPFMPLNTVINFAYIGVGLYWNCLTHTVTEQGVLKDKDSALFYSFNTMTVLYGFVQLLRITTQSVVWAVLDQWCTLPFFAHLLVWGLYYQYGWSSITALIVTSISILSYALTLCCKVGFEISLGLHIIGALCGAIMAYKKHSAKESLISFYLALLSCAGFVVLKLLDHHLIKLSPIFKYISGHFLSKICDVFQLYFVNNFFLDLTLQKSADMSIIAQNKYVQNCESNGIWGGQLSNDIMYELPERKKDA